MNRPWLDPQLPEPERIQLLLGTMTLREKVGQMHQIANVTSTSQDEELRAGGIGSSLFASGAWAGNQQDAGVRVEGLNAVQRIAVEESPLGIPLIFARDVIHGFRTVFPIPLGQAAAWDPESVGRAAEIAALEAAAAGLHWTFTPMLDIARDPRWGRIAEGSGEDPHLGSILATAAVRGYQGDDLRDEGRIAACAKHYIGYGAAEGGRDYNSTQIGPRTLRDVYLPPFAAAVRAGVATVMASFNEIDGIPVTGSHELIRDLLKGELGFDGFVVSDWGAVGELIAHGFAADAAEAVRKSVEAGIDMDMVSGLYDRHLAAEVEAGRVDAALVDDAVRRILRIKFRLGLFERPYTDPGGGGRIGAIPARRGPGIGTMPFPGRDRVSRPTNVQQTPPAGMTQPISIPESHRARARRLATRSLVLLKNTDSVLPLRTPKRILLTGAFARARTELFGTWTLDGQESDVTTIEEALRAALPAEVKLETKLFPDEAVVYGRYADAIIACIGEHPIRSGEANSTGTIDLPPGQLEALKGLRAYGVPLIVVVFAGRPLALPWLADHADAILYAWHPGVEGAGAVVDVLLGNESPSGRLPVSFPRRTGQIPIYYNHRPTGRPVEGGLRGGNRYCDGPDTPLYPFGFGLGYTTFEYSDLRLSSASMRTDGEIEIRATLRNSGAVAGEEVAQLYVRDLAASVSRPVKELKGFARIALAPGESGEVTFRLLATDLAFSRLDGSVGVEPGGFRCWIGPDATRGIEGGFDVPG